MVQKLPKSPSNSKLKKWSRMDARAEPALKRRTRTLSTS